ALRTLSLARTLAEPNLVALNGQTANFQAGGQFPIPVIGAGGAAGGAAGTNLQGVSFVPFGVQLQFTPLILNRDTIRLQLNAEVSALDATVGTNIGGAAGGTSVSGLSNNSFQTTVQLRSGQTLAVAGLIESSLNSSAQRVPLWGDLPLIGATGGARSTTSSETELVVLVTPELVAPVDGHFEPPLPGDDVFEPTDIEFYLSNRLESRRSRNHRASVRTDFARQRTGENCCAQQFMIGPVGPTDRCPRSPATVPHRVVPKTTVSPATAAAGAPAIRTSLSDLIQGDQR
ncbi:MAG: type II and III secretion system protein, partial [Pirellulales bacterium]|nr:type II and III secretion system protein [Pirellulales bacterium]